LKKSERTGVLQRLESLPADTPRILLATGKLIGEGFDHAPLDTLILAMPISWKGTLQQYVGRLHREHASKTDILVIDFIDQSHPSLLRMWNKRQTGYKAMGYQIDRIAVNHPKLVYTAV
jgi:superfamily II DNA or RNA helicase